MSYMLSESRLVSHWQVGRNDTDGGNFRGGRPCTALLVGADSDHGRVRRPVPGTEKRLRQGTQLAGTKALRDVLVLKGSVVTWIVKPMRAAWKKLGGVGVIESIRQIRDKIRGGRRYAIASYDGGQTGEMFARNSRSHWRVENGLRDVFPPLPPTCRPQR